MYLVNDIRNEMNTENVCSICERAMIKGRYIDEHHLIPKAKNGKYTDKILIHRICHDKIHSIWTESELASYYNTVERIRTNSDMMKFIKWVNKKPCDFYTKTKMSNSRRR